NPNTRLSGDAWATMLLGVLDNNTNIATVPLQRPRVSYYGVYVHDDWKITQRLTLNIGLRYEYESPMTDPQDRLSRYLDLTTPIPEFQGAGAPVIPADVLALRKTPIQWNGAWVFTDSKNRNSWNAPKNLFLPRFGLAYRVDNKTALRFGYARYVVPGSLTDGLDILGSVFYPGYDATTTAIAPINGIPQQRLSNPFPGGLVPAAGKQFGTYTNLGGAASWYYQNFRVGTNDRINFTLERQLPWNFVGNITYFTNIGSNHPYSRDGGNYFVDVNTLDPRYGYELKTAITRSVPNPFRNILPADKMPGQLRTQANVAVSDLLKPFPQYGQLRQALTPGADSRYHALQLQFQRPFTNGFSLVFGYNYNRGSVEQIYDELDLFLQNLSWQPNPDPRHRFTGASIYQLPFGKGRQFLNNVHPVADAVLGGWALSGIYTYNTGELLRFDGLLQTGDPVIDNPTQSRMFDTTVFKVLPGFTRRENPLYPGVRGPGFNNLDLTLAKQFKLTESLGFELRMEAYNALNNFNGANPITNFSSGQFGAITAQRAGYFGRQFQYSGRLRW
ncbi:MAG TPA: TonB-dependent receptor, partial [Bryobacteraceae bacterium]|nr:TonB-dependent receptor [Bryobacteraceae bacterium]